jgi:mannosyl-oligosaccharide alpha-1,2-mannosidase
VAPEAALLAEVGSLSLEFTRLSQVSGDPKYFDAIERITEHFLRQQNSTKLPGLWPITVNLRTADLTADHMFSLGAMADSTYEYLVKVCNNSEELFLTFKLSQDRCICCWGA